MNVGTCSTDDSDATAREPARHMVARDGVELDAPEVSIGEAEVLRSELREGGRRRAREREQVTPQGCS